MKLFLSDNLLECIEKGLPVSEHSLWANKTEHGEEEVYWIGAKPDTWLIIADVLYQSGDPGKTLADAIANQFGMERKLND